jgi:hypothetical protein
MRNASQHSSVGQHIAGLPLPDASGSVDQLASDVLDRVMDRPGRSRFNCIVQRHSDDYEAVSMMGSTGRRPDWRWGYVYSP